jgi:transcriptional regulator with XRE-family HTH domain
MARELGAEFVRFRMDRGLSQEALAEKLKLSLRQLQNIEAGRPQTSFVSFLTLAGLMKEERQLPFMQQMLGKLRALEGIRPVRRPDTAL